MARKYTKVEELAEIIVQRQEAGETYREIGASLGLSRDEARGAAKRWRRKSGRLQQGIFRFPRDARAKMPIMKKQDAITRLCNYG